MALERYRDKRDFKRTLEPRGGAIYKKKKNLTYLIQKHAARQLHYDLRLELNGVLLSWAVPKGPSLDPAEKRLAVQVEDHPLEYGSFEGTIPAEQYGGGTVMLWDRGTWIPKRDAEAGYAKGELKFELLGEKLHGGWTLVRMRGRKYNGDGKPSWLLIKATDKYARTGVDGHIVDTLPDSVASGRSLDEIASDRKRVWHSERSVAANVKAGALSSRSQGKASKRKSLLSVSAIRGAKKSPLPRTLTPELATLVDSISNDDGWLHEIKYDGYRIVCRIDHGKAQVFSRNGKEWSGAFPHIATAATHLKVKSAWLDGEVVVLMPDGRTSFQQLQNALAAPESANLVYFVFDVPFLDGYDIRGAELRDRKRLLHQIVPDSDATIRRGVEIQGQGEQVFQQTCKLGFEGVVSKRLDSIYREGVRNKDWVKIKCGKRQEMVVGGFTDPKGSREGFGALLLGVYDADGTLRYSGKVGTGFDQRLLTSLRKGLDQLRQEKTSFANPPRGYEARGVHWVMPTLVAEVGFTEWTREGTLRHPSFQGLREDKNAKDVVREYPVDGLSVSQQGTKLAASRRTQRESASADPRQSIVAAVALSHPDKILFPEAKLTKRDIAEYYAKAGKWIIPHLQGRPLSLVRCPDGWKGQCFYHKHADKSVNAAVKRVSVPEGNGTAIYLSADSLTAVVGLVQWGVAEIHPWGSRLPRLDRPDRLIFDFDPDDAVPWPELVSAVKATRTLLENIGLRAYLKTTGGKGLHIVLPIRPTLGWNDAKAFTKAVANLLVSTFPDRFVATSAKAQRKNKIFIDYLRNSEGATAVAPYSVRARSNAPVSTPIAWEELAKDVRFDYFNVSNLPVRLARRGKDPWEDFFKLRQTVTRSMIRRVGLP